MGVGRMGRGGMSKMDGCVVVPGRGALWVVDEWVDRVLFVV